MNSQSTSELFEQLPDEKDALTRVQLFRDVELDTIQHLLIQCRFIFLNQDEILISPEKANANLYLVLSGRLSVYLNSGERQQVLTSIDKGECVGEISIIDDKLPSATVQATEACQLLCVPKDILWQMIACSHAVSRNLLFVMSDNIRFSNRIISNSMEAQQLCQRFAMFDPVTGLHNRAWLGESFRREIERSHCDEDTVSLLMFDVDNFKQYNDQYGHLAGDMVLRMIGDRVHDCLRPNDMTARFGGEEFAVLLPQTDAQEALSIADRIRQHIALQRPGRFGDTDLPGITLSLGVSELSADMQLDDLLHQADEAMYRAKFNGKNCVAR